jgi:hypothetical protein
MTLAQAALVVNILNTMPRDARWAKFQPRFTLKVVEKCGKSIDSGGKSLKNSGKALF